MNHFFQKELPPLKGILLTMLLALAGFLVFLSLGTLINALIMGGFSSPDSTTAKGLMSIRLLQVFQTFGLFLFPALAISFFSSPNPKKYLGLNRVSLSFLVYSIVIMILFIPGVNLIASLNAQIPLPSWMIDMEEVAAQLTKKILTTDSIGVMALNFFVVAIMPAVAEELFFRGLIQKYLIGWTGRTFWGVLLAAVIFSAIHMQFQGFIPRLLLGMLFGYLYVWSGSIWAPIAAHLANNGLAVVVYYLIGKGAVSSQLETFGNASDMWQAGVVSLAMTGLLLWVVWRERVRHHNLSDSVPTSEAP
jgi:membrane protease YdiL (CAAX protease family)